MYRELGLVLLAYFLKLLRRMLFLSSKRMPFRPWRPQAAAKSSNSSQITSTSPSLHPPLRALTESQRQMYELEKEENFRWIARLLASPSNRVLTSDDLVSHDMQREIADIGQYAEVAHGYIDPDFVWRNLSRLVRPTYPLEGYGALSGSQLVCVFHGRVAKLQGYIAYRPTKQQLVVAFSGTSSPLQALHDIDARLVEYTASDEKTSKLKEACKVHSGMWRLYQGVRQLVFDNFAKALLSLDIAELVLTGHSLGAVTASLFTMELLQNSLQLPATGLICLPPSIIVKLVGFGSPRVGNEALARFYRKLISEYREERGKDSFQEYMVKGYNDGVPCLPPKAIGFRHLNDSPLYLFHGQLLRIPPSENEHSVFPVQLEDDTGPADYPLGGHNYYNNRDMEKMQRRIRCLKLLTLGEAGWEERYMRYLTKESRDRP
ncbi:hypothetical protein ACEPAG_687 [Sanghuangporus baumii]